VRAGADGLAWAPELLCAIDRGGRGAESLKIS
jgi:hypothetical protein